MLTLDVTKRSKTDNVAHMRSNGMVPGVVYGAKVENTSVVFPKNIFEKVFREARETTTVNLVLDGKTIQVLIHDVQYDPVKGFPMHVDFLAVDADTKTVVSVPLEFAGVAPAQKGGLGNVVKVAHEIEIASLPKDIPQKIIVDLGGLDSLDSQITAGELSLPAGVELMTKKDEILVSITPLHEESESATVDLASIEVKKKGKKDEE